MENLPSMQRHEHGFSIQKVRKNGIILMQLMIECSSRHAHMRMTQRSASCARAASGCAVQ